MRTVDKGVMDVEETEFWERLKIHTVPLVRYMGNGMEGQQTIREEFEEENKAIVIPTQVRWLANPQTMRERRQTRRIAGSSAVFFVIGSRAAPSLVKNSITGAKVWYRVEMSMNKKPGSRWEPRSGWGYIENKYGSKLKSGYWLGHHRTSDHNCDVVGCTAKQGSLCSHTLEKCPKCKGQHIVVSSMCVKNTETTEVAQQSRSIELAGQVSTSAARDMAMAMGSDRVALGSRPQGVAEEGGDKEEMAEVDEEVEAVGWA